MKNISVPTKRGILLNGALFGGGAETVVIAITGIGHGIDSIEVSGNGTSVSGIKPHINEAYFVEAAAELARISPVPVILVGGHRKHRECPRIHSDDRHIRQILFYQRNALQQLFRRQCKGVSYHKINTVYLICKFAVASLDLSCIIL